MFEPEYEYSVLVNNVHVLFSESGKMRHWDRDFTKVVARAHELREINERATVTIEISPWACVNDFGAISWFCPGCEYAECPCNV